MQKTILTLAAASFALMTAAAPVSLNQAKAIAAGVTGGNGAKVPAARLELAQQAVNAQGETDYYVFNRADDKGFIIVAGDDRALPVLGYSDDGSFVPGETPCGLEYLLEVYSAEMSDLRSNPAARARKAVTLNSEVAPILTSTWDQSTPFNNQAPTINNRRCYTGCVATAISQVMDYYKWPETGTGSKTYTWKYTLNGQSYSTKLTANFASSTYDWANMLDSYSNGYNDDQAAAVSLLLKDVGYAVSMTYGTSSSGAADTQQAPALRDYFSYPEATWERHVNYEQDEWEAMIRSELDAGRPVVFNGATPAGSGHSFVLDGYNNAGLFHVNWGWNGQSNGYFAVTSMNPSSVGTGGAAGGYSQSQTILTHIRKPDPATAEVYTKGFANAFYPAKASVALGDTLAATRYANYQVNGYGVSLANLYAVARVYNEAETEVVYEFANKSNGAMVLGKLYNWSTNFSPKADLPVGKYHIKAAYKLDEDAEVVEFVRPLDSLNYVLMEVKEDKIAYFSSPKAEANLLLIGTEVNSVVAGNVLPVVATVKNTGIAYEGDVTLTLAPKDAAENAGLLAAGAPVVVTLQNVVIKRSAQEILTADIATEGLEPGSYTLTIADKNGATVGEPIDVTLLSTTSGVTDAVAAPMSISTSGRTIAVRGAGRVAVYDMSGRLVSRDATTTVTAGFYVVVADGTAAKVAVK